MMSELITLPKPDDWHCHLRDGHYLSTTVPHTAARFGRAVVMPNLMPPVTTIAAVQSYYQRIQHYIPDHTQFQPLMTLYLTEQTTPELIYQAAQHPHIIGCKLYPAGATTHSQAGVHDITRLYPIFAAMERAHLPLLIHGEVTTPEVDIFDREAVFIDTVLTKLLTNFPALKVVLEHITTQYAVDFICSQTGNIGATITVHHLYLNRNDLLVGGIRPDYYCLPIVKCETDRLALLKVACSGHPQFFLGTDSAPHPTTAKYQACGCAGIYTAHAAIELLAELFVANNARQQLAAFASINGAQFYQLPIATEPIHLIRLPWKLPERFAFGEDYVIPFFAGKTVAWQIQT